MSQALAIAKELILKPASLDESTIAKLVHSIMGQHVDDADLYFESSSYESWYLEDSEVKAVVIHSIKGLESGQ